jgi:hypothetical protein
MTYRRRPFIEAIIELTSSVRSLSKRLRLAATIDSRLSMGVNEPSRDVCLLRRTYAVEGVGEAKLPQKLLLATIAAAMPPLSWREKGFLAGLQPAKNPLPNGDRVSPVKFNGAAIAKGRWLLR